MKRLRGVSRVWAWLLVPVTGMVMACGAAAQGSDSAKPLKIVLVGDSTVNAGGGWGKGFCDLVTPNVSCVNEALNGRSSKSFIDEGAWAKALGDRGDYYLIQFGHNDQKPDGARHTDPETTYEANLRRYVQDVRSLGAVPVLVTSLSRRNYQDGRLVEDLSEYASATREVARSEGVALIDLNALSVKMLRGMSQEQADSFDATGHADAAAERRLPAKADRTHLNTKGQALFGRMVARELVRDRPELAGDFSRDPGRAEGAE